MQRSAYILTIFLLITTSLSALSDEYLPANLFELDNKFNHHVLLVEKSTHSLFLYKNTNTGIPKLLKKYQVATGKIIGNKQLQGDKKTPEGVYTFRRFHSSEQLVTKYDEAGLIYGAGAFTMNYPNEMDARDKKTGGGIWLHSTDDDNRISKGLDSRGCVVATNQDLKDISKYIELGSTSTVIVQDLHFLTRESWTKKKSELVNFFDSWIAAWQNKDFRAYINSYSQPEFANIRGRFRSFKNYKRRIFAKKDSPQINFDNRSILLSKDYAVITFRQHYKSKSIKDTGKKTLYLKQDDKYQWKIVSEKFHKLRNDNDTEFVPTQRFFSNSLTTTEMQAGYNDPKSI